MLRGKGCPFLGLVACLSRGLWSSPERKKAVVGISSEAGAMSVRTGIEGLSACPELCAVFKC